MARLHSSQRTGGVGEEQAVQGATGQNAMASRQQAQLGQQGQQSQQGQTPDVNADRDQHVSGPPLGSGTQMGQQGGVSESGDRGAMMQTSLPSGTKSHRTWTQTSGGQQATQTSLEGGQWPAQAQGQSQQQGQNQQEQSGRLQQNQPEVRSSSQDVNRQMEQDAAERRDSQVWHPEEGSHQQQLAGSQGGIEDAGPRRQHNQDNRSQATGEMLEQRQGLRGEKEDAASPLQRSLGQHDGNLDEQQQQGGAGGQDPNRQPGSGGQRAEAVADRIQDGTGDGKSGGRPSRRR